MSTDRLTHVFVAGLGHSGSTILNIALGANQGGLSLGEVENTVRQSEGSANKFCTCGKSGAECPVWSAVLKTVEHDTEIDIERAYSSLYETARKHGAKFIVDSSKGARSMALLPELRDVNVKVIVLTKDPRNHFVSHYRKWLRQRERASSEPAAEKNGGQYKLKKRKEHARTFVGEVWDALSTWFFGSRKIIRFLNGSRFDSCFVSYEDLVLSTPAVEAKLSGFLGFDIYLSKLQSQGHRHILRGNSLRHDPERSSSLRYDYRWYYDPWVRRLGPFMNFLVSWGLRKGLLPREH